MHGSTKLTRRLQWASECVCLRSRQFVIAFKLYAVAFVERAEILCKKTTHGIKILFEQMAFNQKANLKLRPMISDIFGSNRATHR